MRMTRATAAICLMVAGLVLTTGCFLLPNRAPTAAFVVEYNVTADPLVVELDASPSSDPDGDEIATYMWTFGHPGVDILEPLAAFSGTAHVPVIRVRFVEEGEYSVGLLVIDERGAASEAAFSAVVRVPSIPVAPMP